MTRDMERVGRIAQPFRNYQIDFEPPRITAKPLMFGVDKWLDEQNRSIASRFVKIVCQIEALYRKDAKQQVQAVQRNALVDYQELKRLQLENVRLTDLNGCQAALMQEFIDQLAELSVRERIFSIADALIGGQPVAVSSGGGGNSDSDLRWDGRRPDEEEEAYREGVCYMPHRLSVILTKAPSTDKLQFYINFSDTVWIAAASVDSAGASERGGREWRSVGALERDGIKMRSGRGEVAAEKGGRVAVKGGAARWLWAEKLTGRPKENGGRAYALPPFVMRGCALLRLPDQNTMTGLRKRRLICEYGARELWPNDTLHAVLKLSVDDQVP